MSFNRITYDKCAYDLKMNRSTNVGNYRLFCGFAEHCEPCLSYDGPIGSKSDVSTIKKPTELDFSEMTQAESELSWRRNSLVKCNTENMSYKKYNLKHKNTCSNNLTSEDTRFTHPTLNYRSMSLTDYYYEPYLQTNPQCYIQPLNDKTGLNSRMKAKDNFKLPEQKYLDNGEALPVEKK